MRYRKTENLLKRIDFPYPLCYSKRVMEEVLFFAHFRAKEKQTKNLVEVEAVRVKITLACTECKQRNYNMTKDKKTHPDRMETKKYCKFCKSHTLHKETK